MNKLYAVYAKSSLRGLHTIAAIVSGIFYISGKLLVKEDYVRTGEIIFFLGVISYIIHLNQHNLHNYINQSEKIRNFPAGEIRLKNNLFLMAFLVIAAGIMLLLPMLPIEALTDIIKAGLVFVLKGLIWIASKVFNFSGSEPSADESPVEKWEPGSAINNTPIWAVIGDILLKLLAFLSIAALFIWLIFTIYKKLTHRRKKPGIEIREFILPEMMRERVRKKETEGRRKLFWDLSPNGRMRKLYMQRVRKAGNKGRVIPKSFTPEEIEEFAGIKGTFGSEELHLGYEKARYSKDGCSDEEVRRIRKAGKLP